jgi:hypothetical protein
MLIIGTETSIINASRTSPDEGSKDSTFELSLHSPRVAKTLINYLGFSWFLAVSWVEKPLEIADPTY